MQNILKQPIEINQSLILELISYIDLTTLNNTDGKQSVLNLVEKANKGFNDVHPAAVCVFSNFGELAKSFINSDINVAVVSGCFPSGQTLTKAKLYEIDLVNQTNVEEVDVVINRGQIKWGALDQVTNELLEIRKRLPFKKLKVILETGELETEEDILVASKLAIEAGADFIKTSTGKTSVGATPEAVFTMCKEIKRHYIETDIKIGIKPSGGIRTLDDAIIYYKIVKGVLGEKWLTPDLFRIGASSLYDHLIQEYQKL